MPSKRPCILAIDLGTSGPKVGAVTADGALLDSEFVRTELVLLPGGGAEQDPAEWWSAICTATSHMLARGAVAAEDIAAVNCTCQWSGTVAVDRHGEPLMNAIIWMDTRGARHIRKLVGGPLSFQGYGLGKALRWISLTGGAPGLSGKDPIAHILYLRHERPEIYRASYKLLEPKDYLNLQLTGQLTTTVDTISLHWVTDNRDIGRIRYSDALLGMSGLERDKLPELHPSAAVLGPICESAARDLGLSERVQVVGGSPDVLGAAIGSGAVRDYEAHLYVGTSSWLTCHVPFKKTDIVHNMATLPSAIPNRYLVANEQETAGACLTFLRDKLLCADDELGTAPPPADFFQRLDQLAARAPAGAGRVIFTPWLYGERTPVEDHTVRGAFFNLSLDSTRAHLVRAVLEGVAHNARWLLGYLEKMVGRRLDPIRFIGGGAKSALWCQVFADILDRTICQVEQPIEANLRGAAFQAAVALGHLSFDEVPERVPIAQSFAPDPAKRAIYDELFGEFLNLYRQNRRIHARLNRG